MDKKLKMSTLLGCMAEAYAFAAIVPAHHHLQVQVKFSTLVIFLVTEDSMLFICVVYD